MQDIYHTLPATVLGEGRDEYQVAIRLLDQYFSPQVNVAHCKMQYFTSKLLCKSLCRYNAKDAYRAGIINS